MKKRVSILIITLLFLLPISFAYEINYYHNDHLGSPAVITNQNRERVYSIDYKPFGEEFNEDNDQGDNRLTYNTKEKDSTGLHYYGARYYDSDLGRFITTDPTGGDNVYIYTRNNPLKYVDPDGLDIKRLIGTYGEAYKLYASPGQKSGIVAAHGARLESPNEPRHTHIFKGRQQLPRVNLETGTQMNPGRIPSPLMKKIRKNLPGLRKRADDIFHTGKTSLGPITLAITAIFIAVDVASAEEGEKAITTIDALDPGGAIGGSDLNPAELSDLYDPKTGFDYLTGECVILELCGGKILENGVVREIQCGDTGFIGPCQEEGKGPGASQMAKPTGNVKQRQGEDVEIYIDRIKYGPS